MKIQQNTSQNYKKDLTFGQNLGSVRFSKLADAFDSKCKTLAQKTTMVVDDALIKHGDIFYMITDKGIEPAIFKGALDSITSFDENGHKTIELMYQKVADTKPRKLSTYLFPEFQIFSNNGLKKLQEQIKAII
ncbi:MAG: hypothetical protein WCY19_00925 [Candidatus Gastranaerophilaceae bacterium]